MHPILIDLGLFKISSYGVFVASAYLIGILWLKSQIRWMPGIDEDKFWVLIYGLFFGAIVGGKLLYVLVDFRHYASDPMAIVHEFRYGFVFFGGLLGSIAMGFLIQRRLKFPYLAVADYFGVALPMGHWLGRLGCLAAGCCYGRATTVPWAVRLGGPASSTPEALWGVPLHPTQAYESLADIAIFVFLLKWALPLAKQKKIVPGTVFLSYVFLYSICRFFNEFYRGDDRGWSAGGLWISQWVALACVAAMGAAMARRGIWAGNKK